MNSNMNALPGRQTISRLILMAAILLSGIAWIVTATPAAANTINVTTTADELNSAGDCSLREAIRAANLDQRVDGCTAGNGADIINLPAGTYDFSTALIGTGEDEALTGDLDIRDDLTIIGAGMGSTIIDANYYDRVFHLLSAGNVTLAGVTITQGDAHDNYGGGIYVAGSNLTLIDSEVKNSRTGFGTGGGLYNGGGIAIRFVSAVTVVNSRVHLNTSAGGGGGIAVGANTVESSSLTLRDSRVDHNEAITGGGIYNLRPLTVTGSLIDNNLANAGSQGGGGIYSGSTAFISNSTISGNSSNSQGGGIAASSEVPIFLYNVTITGNTADEDNLLPAGDGGGISNNNGHVYLRNSLIAGNFDKSTASKILDCAGTFDSDDYNLIQSAAGCTLTGDTSHNLIGVDPFLQALADNGGPTETHAVSSASPAVATGDPDGCLDHQGELSTDQRGFVRPVQGHPAGGPICDIGAYEHDSPGPPTTTPTSIPTATFNPPSTPTATPTDGQSATPSATVTDGPSPTPSATATDGPSPTPSATATEGPSPTPSATPTEGPSPTPFAATDWVYFPVSLDQ